MTARPPVVDAGERHQRRLAARGLRKAQGAWYTPADVVEGLLALVLDPLVAERSALGADAVASLRVLDPSCGSGNFLVAAGRRIADALVDLGVDRTAADATAFGRCVVGVDLDPVAVRLCRAALREAAGGAVAIAGTTRQVRRADALLLAPGGGAPSWAHLQRAVGAPMGFDLVVGNPPFLNQLEAGTAHAREHAAALRARFGSAVAGYTDPAALFLLLAHERARADGGVVALVEPLPVVSTRDSGPVRRAVLADAGLHLLWVAGEQVFDAAVLVCAPVLVRGRPAERTTLVRGRSFDPAGRCAAPSAADPSWSGLLASMQGLPERELATAGVLGDVATATADFRDQFYGLAPHVVDAEHAPDGHHPPLLTTGLIDPLRAAWGERTTAFARTRYRHPRVDVASLAEPLQAWAAQRLVPKVLVATQTRVLEAVVDEEGAWLPSVPVVTVLLGSGAPPGLGRWHLAAVLSSPPATLVAARRHLGAARNGEALKLSAKDLLALPLPTEGGRAAWDGAAADLEAAATAAVAGDHAGHHRHLVAAAAAMLDAYGLAGDDELLRWWEGRLPRRR